MTTNRVGHIDEAFMSRVHVIIGFERLDPEKRKAIWQSFLDKLASEREGQIRVAPSAIGFLLGKEMCDIDWNGREIRNAFQTAIALAEYDTNASPYQKEGDEIIVESDHFRKVIEMSRSFRMYIDSIRRDTEEERARDLYGRNDYFRAQNLIAGHVQAVQYSQPDPHAAIKFTGQDQRNFDIQPTAANGRQFGGHYYPGAGASSQGSRR